ncbi:uncharacterized protein LOC124807953 [Hydra vulgaris]|uniref:uncharacterized protein LOC124807953 n=1 Tax=Hydra vulgaris TaxID=6087 RepID=UPI001F5F733B|nr:uncharacterized protein LOC124807953 [Hydra vulgaris]
MNMPRPMTKKNYGKITKLLHSAYVEAANTSMSNAEKEIHDIVLMDVISDNTSIVDCHVSVDGTWQKRGHTSINGVVTLISTNNQKCDKTINTLQNYYGTAIRQILNSIYGMKKGFWATLFHNLDILGETGRHKFCPRNVNSWCMWQSNKLTGKSTYKAKLNIPLAINEILKPIFQDLSRDELLSKCLHGQTQNNNEAINNFILKKCPKDVYVSQNILEIAVASAVLEFNDGASGIYEVFQKLQIKTGRFMDIGTI